MLCLTQLLIGLDITAATAKVHPETLPWLLCYSVSHTSLVASLLLPLFCEGLRRRREAYVLLVAAVTMAAAMACHANQYMQDSAELGWRLYIQHIWMLFVWRGVWLPLMQQLTMRNHLAGLCCDTCTYVSITWLLVHNSMSLAALAVAMLTCQAAATAIALLSDWLWRREFLKHCQWQAAAAAAGAAAAAAAAAAAVAAAAAGAAGAVEAAE